MLVYFGGFWDLCGIVIYIKIMMGGFGWKLKYVNYLVYGFFFLFYVMVVIRVNDLEMCMVVF